MGKIWAFFFAKIWALYGRKYGQMRHFCDKNARCKTLRQKVYNVQFYKTCCLIVSRLQNRCHMVELARTSHYKRMEHAQNHKNRGVIQAIFHKCLFIQAPWLHCPPNHPENLLFWPEFQLSFAQISQKPWGGWMGFTYLRKLSPKLIFFIPS